VRKPHRNTFTPEGVSHAPPERTTPIVQSATVATKFRNRGCKEVAMPSTTNSASWDFNPNDPVNLTAAFSFDTEDTQDNAPVATALAAIQGRISRATVTATQTDPATITVAISI